MKQADSNHIINPTPITQHGRQLYASREVASVSKKGADSPPARLYYEREKALKHLLTTIPAETNDAAYQIGVAYAFVDLLAAVDLSGADDGKTASTPKSWSGASTGSWRSCCRS